MGTGAGRAQAACYLFGFGEEERQDYNAFHTHEQHKEQHLVMLLLSAPWYAIKRVFCLQNRLDFVYALC